MAIFRESIKHVEPSSLKKTEPDGYGHEHPIENEEIVREALSLFDKEIKKLPEQDKAGVIKAKDRCPEIVDTEEHKLMFLRSERFVVDLAVRRFVSYWDKRIELFGEKAFSPLTLSGPLKDDREALNTGFCRLLPSKEETGRSILFFDPALLDDSRYSRDSMLRAIWYIVHVALQDEETQRRGFIFMNNNGNDPKISQFDRVLVSQCAKSVQHELPVLVGALYILHIPKLFSVLLNVVKHALGSSLSKQMKVVSGSDETVLEKLEKHDMRKEHMPKDLGGGHDLDHEAWIQQRLEVES
mmetsp:Transcript_15549/g.21241  ORF Transcript_15549/g.21241 Transcript_15549/m.21241 type:complete len:298 (-) Transcript_15549:278-1171(-)|eukprot:CAMPEP_0185726314 /NCGR_PEP_ID=MMETSP1171-20130828/2331_1 /TAXON_ID=374046 /ORGANISM="Helicotheca tamensis, Strain CCMP826" /LENGTH=297 /DNA_ID=CAMNT_0028394639 /DNA_START=155 /DNA_END=1048 /DNA_ORIENTATION=-